MDLLSLVVCLASIHVPSARTLTVKEAGKRCADVGPGGKGGAFRVQPASMGMNWVFWRPRKEFTRTGVGGRGEHVGLEAGGRSTAPV